MRKPDGGMAFPMAVDCSAGSRTEYQIGMSLRDFFAACCITGTLPGARISEMDVAEYARWAYRMADAMLADRQKL